LVGTVLADEPMARHTTWRVGGPADLFIEPADLDDLLRTLELLKSAGVPWMVVGAGSNLLVKDGGIRGAVLYLKRFRQLDIETTGRVTAGGGLPLMTLIRETTAVGLAGLEALAGIPGTVGGGVAMNAGAGGQQLADVVESAVLTGPAGIECWTKGQLQFAYRSSALDRERILISAVMQFRRGEVVELAAAVQQQLVQRRSAQRVGGPNAGSVFKNPPGHSAWKLIEAAGMRGAVIGGAKVAEQHANFIVNGGQARAQDILALIERIRKQVRVASGIELEPEVRIVGADPVC
jgi:UDP-N-acetylmuramate dehydrogenase